MSYALRCPKCFGPKDNPDAVCEFCGLDPMEYKSIAEFSSGLFAKPKEYEPLPDGMSLDEKIRILNMRR